MAAEGKLFSKVLDGFWMDIGQPKDFLLGTQMYLRYLEENKDERLCHEAYVEGNVLIDPTATVDPTALIGPNVTIGKGCVVGPGARVKDSVLLPHSKID